MARMFTQVGVALMASLKIEPEIILMQLERSYEALAEEVHSLKDVDHDYCDCNCHEDAVDRLETEIDRLNERVEKLESYVEGLRVGLHERISELEALVRGTEAR